MSNELFPKETALATVPPVAPITPLSLIQSALSKNVAPEILKELVALQQSMVRFEWEAQERQSRIDFDEALSRIQSKIQQITPNKPNAGGKVNAWYLTYAKLDSVIRPLYTQEGFSVCFGEEDCPVPSKIRVVANVSRGGVTRKFIKDVTPPLLGPKGEPVMTPTHGDTSANSYARRYLMYDIFNIAIGIGGQDNDGNAAIGLTVEVFAPLLEAIENASTPEQLMAYLRALEFAKTQSEKDQFKAARIKRKGELRLL